MNFPPSRDAGLARLQDFLPRAGRDYAASRNFDLGPVDRWGVSALSPYLRYRLVTEPEVMAAVLDYYGPSVATKFVQEVAWRTYWKGWLELRPAIWSQYLAERDRARDTLSETPDLAQAVAEAKAGRTGIEGFDDWAQELVSFGYLHNHARMWFASIWIFTLRLPWTLGADFFLQHLIDGDPASNTLSWRWVAGLQTRGKTYLATADNIARYTDGRFNPVGLASSATPLSESRIPAAKELAPMPVIHPDQRVLLLVTAEDLTPESVLPDDLIVCAIAFASRSSTLDWPWSDKANAFVDGAIKDAVIRLENHFGHKPTLMDGLDAAAVCQMAEIAGVVTVVTPYAAVGPVATRLKVLEAALVSAGMELIRLRRRWDERLWPHATRGYFAFRDVLPEVLQGDFTHLMQA